MHMALNQTARADDVVACLHVRATATAYRELSDAWQLLPILGEVRSTKC